MVALLNMRVTTTTLTSLPVRQHGDFSFRTATSRQRWCRRHEIIFSDLFFVLLWLDLATIKRTRENKFQISLSRSLVTERRRKKEEEEDKKKEVS
jgi:hypothetical protein